ncbi:MAG: histidine kinase [Saprospiraceae bacterium]
MAEIKLSDLFREKTIHLYEKKYLVREPENSHDTIRLAFDLINDLGKDTTVYYYQSNSDWFQLITTPLLGNDPPINRISGRVFFGKIPYESIYFPSQFFHINSGSRYHCEMVYKGPAYRRSSHSIYLLSGEGYREGLDNSRRFEGTNFIITDIFLGAIGFGFFFFFFLYFKSRYSLFGLYSLFLFVQALYAFIQIDVYTKLGHFLIYFTNSDDYFNEVLAFTAQSIYVRFLIAWLDIKSTNRLTYQIFKGISIFFLVYAISIFVFYSIDPQNTLIDTMENAVRLLTVLFQLVVLYLLLFKIKSDIKSYVITGTLLMVLFGIVMVFLNLRNVFNNTLFSDLDNGSWYMLGVLAESMCFAMGLGLRYFHIKQENIQLQAENMHVLQGKLATEQEARERERMLAELNQELTNQQLTALRAQMNPHFIFNALNSIQKYIMTGNVDEANSYLSKFSKLQRMILSYCDENFITLDKEINMLQLYLELEQLRLTDDFTFTIEVDDDIDPEEIQIPPMMLQPFAENAIWHGLVPKEGIKKLSIHFFMPTHDVLKCMVEDNGVGRAEAGKNKAEKLVDSTVNKSKGLSLVYNRLAILERKYGKEFSVDIRDKVDAVQNPLGTIVELTIPVAD